MFVYSLYFKTQKIALVYPAGAGYKNKDIKGKFEKTENITSDLIFIEMNGNIKEWQKEIASKIFLYL
jgi:hypothetical protein